MAIPSDLIIAGFERALFGFRDSLGISTGQQSTLANGSTSGAYVAPLVRTASFEALAPVNLPVEGGDIQYSLIQFGNSKTQPFDLILSNQDETLTALISAAVKNVVNSMATIMSDNPAKNAPRTMWLALQSRAADTLTGDQLYITRFFPSCQMRIKRKGPAYQALSDVVISCTPQMVNKDITGAIFGTSGLNMGLQGDQTDNYDYISTKPIHVVSLRQNTAITTFSTVYKPISTVITLNATPNPFYIGGVATALVSLTLAGLATLVAAGTIGVGDVLIHETDYVPI